MTLVHAWPNQAEAARLLGVHEATLLRRDLPFEAFGGKEKRLPPVVVLEQALHFKRVPAQQVAAGLYEIALAHAGREQAQLIATEAETFLMARPELRARVLEKTEFLAEARRVLPTGIYKQVAAVYEQKAAPATAMKKLKAGAGRLPARVGAVRKRRRRRLA